MPEEENFQHSLHELRKQIDACVVETNRLRQANTPAGREISLIHTKLQEAKMWGGKALGEMGSELPADYPHDSAEEKADPVPDPEEKPAETKTDKIEPGDGGGEKAEPEHEASADVKENIEEPAAPAPPDRLSESEDML